jgi:hypothetical protein
MQAAWKSLGKGVSGWASRCAQAVTDRLPSSESPSQSSLRRASAVREQSRIARRRAEEEGGDMFFRPRATTK